MKAKTKRNYTVKFLNEVKKRLLSPQQVYKRTLIKPDTLKHWRLSGKLEENIDYIKFDDKCYLYNVDSIYPLANILIF